MQLERSRATMFEAHPCTCIADCIPLAHSIRVARGSHGNDASFSEGCLWERHALRSATVRFLTSLLTSGAAGREAEKLRKAVGH